MYLYHIKADTYYTKPIIVYILESVTTVLHIVLWDIEKTSDLMLSWTTIVVHSRDDKEEGVAHEVKSPKNQPQFSQTTMG